MRRGEFRISEEQVDQALALLRQGQSMAAAARAIGCSRQAIRLRLLRRHLDLTAKRPHADADHAQNTELSH